MTNVVSEDYVGDKIEFVNKQGLWFTRTLKKDSKGLYINFQGKRTRVKQWGTDCVEYRFREV